MKADEFERQVAKGDIGPLYYLYGDEPYLIDRGARSLVEKSVSADFRDFNYNLFYGNECKGEEVVEASQTLPMFAERRVVVVRKAAALSASAMEILAEYADSPCPSTVLLFQGDKIDQRKKFFASLKKKDALVEFKRLFENQLPGFIRNEAFSLGKKVDAEAAELLGYLVGTNLQELVSQMEKLATYAGERSVITLADVKEIVSDTKVDSVFELANALGEKQLAKALRSLQTLLRDGEAPLMMLAMLTRHFRQLWLVRELQSRKAPPSEIAKATGINPYFLKGIQDQARNFGLAEFQRIFERFYATDLALKSSGGKPAHLMEWLVMDICQRT